MKRLLFLFSVAILGFSMVSCNTSLVDTTLTSTIPVLTEEDTISNISDYDGTYVFSNEGIQASLDTNIITSTTLTISNPGVYYLSGDCSDGQIIVDALSNDLVVLVLHNLNLTSSQGSVIKVLNADKVIVYLDDDTESSLTDTLSSSACISSNDDLVINGSGTLNVISLGNGISSDDDLYITSGTVNITSKKDGLHVNNEVYLTTMTLSISSKEDGIHVENLDNVTLGNIYIDSGTLTISSYSDALDASNQMLISGGVLNLISGVNNTSLSTISAKGIKADNLIYISDGDITVTSKDDTLHSSKSITLIGGTLTLASKDDGIHADESIYIGGGKIDITESYEGIESLVVEIDAGEIKIVSSDDGINIAGGNDGSSTFPFPGGGDSVTAGALLTINGGTIFVNAQGDGLDSNGNIIMKGGIVAVSGPTTNANGAIDYNGTFVISGGLLIATGSSGMAQAPSTSSSQNSIMVTLTSISTKLVRLIDEEGNELFTFVPGKSYNSIVISSPELTKNHSYSLYIGGTISNPTSSLGGYSYGGTYLAGTFYSTIQITSTLTTVGQSIGVNPRG